MSCIIVILSFILALPTLCLATNQHLEKLVDEYSEERDMASTPLEDYFSADHPRPNWLKATSSACWRGYIGTWEIRDHSLILNSLYRNVGEQLVEEEVIPLENIFKDTTGHVRADWFSGVLRILDGKRIKSMGFSPVNERDLFISVIQGEVIGKRVVDNTSGNEWSWSDQSWQDLTIESLKSLNSLQVVRTEDLVEEDWLDGQQISERAQDLLESKAMFEVRGLFFGTKLWLPPTRLIKTKQHEMYDFARGGLHYNLDYAPYIDVKEESHSRMAGTTVQVTARFRENHSTLLVSKVTQLPPKAGIQRNRNQMETKQNEGNRLVDR